MSDIAEIYNQAFAALNRRDLGVAEAGFRRVLQADPAHVPSLNLLTIVLMSLERFAEAEQFISKAIALNGSSDVSFYNAGLIAKRLGKPQQAIGHFGRALQLNPNVAATWNNRGTAWSDLKEYQAAISDFDRALALESNNAGAYCNKGKCLFNLRRYEEALAAFDKARALDPNLPGLEGLRLESKMLVCDWTNVGAEIEQLSALVRAGKAAAAPFTMLYLVDSPEDQLQCARTWVAAHYPPAARPQWNGSVGHAEKIRVGYVSADFHSHATSYLMAEVLEHHDRNRFHITAFSTGIDDGSEMRRRVVGALDNFVDCRSLPDDRLADMIARAEIDLLVDLKGFTEDARPNVFARRPAPIQVNYLGYPGSMAAPYMDYIIGDGTLFQPGDEALFSEKLVRLPDSYQPNDLKRRISQTTPSRADCGLPERGFVFCCFNNSYKILPAVFDLWMRILARCDDSVLWLLESNPSMIANLRREAAARAIDPDRLVFAKRTNLSEHLARHRVADLFLDTAPYTAHTTASDALWAGLPLLTRTGRTFASRVAASLLNAIRLPELIAHSKEDYESRAIGLARDPIQIRQIRAKIEDNRLTTPLFDTARYTRHLEAAYEVMHRRHRSGQPPDHIAIRPVATSS